MRTVVGNEPVSGRGTDDGSATGVPAIVDEHPASTSAIPTAPTVFLIIRNLPDSFVA
ncbi:hypothetical protein GCM10009551_089340 [Nocardiopsis tropica]